MKRVFGLLNQELTETSNKCSLSHNLQYVCSQTHQTLSYCDELLSSGFLSTNTL